MNKPFFSLSVALLIALLGACAAREPLPELLAARQTVAAVDQDPDAVKAGALQLAEARRALNSAEKAFMEGKDDVVVQDFANAASKNAQVAKERGAEARSRQAITAAEASRNRVLLEARTQEAEQARATATANAEVASAAREDAERLKAQMAEMQARETERGMVVTLGDVLFDTNEAVIRDNARADLERIARFLAENKGFRVIVEGHTDSRGTDEYNRGLSQRRADAVAAVLLRAGAGYDRIRATGLGESYPVASNENPAGQQQNRRVEIVFSDQEGNFIPGGERR